MDSKDRKCFLDEEYRENTDLEQFKEDDLQIPVNVTLYGVNDEGDADYEYESIGYADSCDSSDHEQENNDPTDVDVNSYSEEEAINEIAKFIYCNDLISMFNFVGEPTHRALEFAYNMQQDFSEVATKMTGIEVLIFDDEFDRWAKAYDIASMIECEISYMMLGLYDEYKEVLRSDEECKEGYYITFSFHLTEDAKIYAEML